MEPLEKIALEAEPIEAKNDAYTETTLKSVSESYEGLVLLDEHVYMGKTSIKYWM